MGKQYVNLRRWLILCIIVGVSYLGIGFWALCESLMEYYTPFEGVLLGLAFVAIAIPRKEFLKRQKHLMKNKDNSLRNVEKHNLEAEDTTSSSTTSYVIEEDGTILRQDNETKSELVDQNDITNISTFSTVSEKLMENSNHPRITSIQTQEEAALEEFILIKRMLAGEQIDFSLCNSLLDTVNDVKLWEVIVKNHLSQPNRPPIDIINNYSSERAIEFMEMIYRIVSSCVATNSDWCQLSPEFLKNIIVFSKNVDVLYCIADMQESDLMESEYDECLFNELKQRAYYRYNFLTTKRKHYGDGFQG